MSGRLSRATLVNTVLVLLACASVVLVWATRGAVTTSDSEGRKQNLLPVFRAEAVTRLELADMNQQIVLQRAAAEDAGVAAFSLISPVKELADAATVDKFLGALASAQALRPVEEGVARGTLGLEHPGSHVVIRTAKLAYDLALGGAAPAPEGARYLELKTNDSTPKLFVVAKSVAEDLSMDLDAFRLRSVVSVAEPDVTRVSINSPTLTLTLVRGPGKSFVLDGEPKRRADRETVTSLFFQLSRMTANRFLGAAEAETALGAQRAHFELETADKTQTVRFDVGGVCPGDPSQLVVVRKAPGAQSACVSRELEASLNLTRDAFVDQHPFSLRTDEVEELEISGEGDKFRLVRKGTGFVLHEKTDTDVELEPGNQRLTDLVDARGDSVEAAKPSELGLEPPRSKVTLRSAGARDADVVEQVVHVGNKDAAGNLLVYREQDGAVLRIPRDQARAFAADATLLHARKLVEFGPTSFQWAEIEQGGTRQVVRRDASGGLQLESPKGFEPDSSLSADLAQALGALTAERFVADADDGSFGLQNPSLTVRFAFKTKGDAEVEHSVRFGSETALGVFATLDKDGPVCVLSRAVADTLSTLLINRAPFATDPSVLDGFSLEAHGHTLRFERRGDRFAPASASTFPEDRLPDLLDALASFRAEAAIHTGPARAAEGISKPILTLRLAPKLGAPTTILVGAGDSWRSTSVFYLRFSNTDATFVIAQSKVRALSDAL